MLLSEKEVFRRLRALIDMPEKERPITIYQLEKMCGFSYHYTYQLAKYNSMHVGTRRALSAAFKLIENDQVVVQKHKDNSKTVSIREPQPPQEIVRKLEITSDGPKLRLYAQNPNTFPEFKEKT